MKLVIAQMKHETNTYSPVPTPLGRFAGRSGIPAEGAQAIGSCRGTGSAIGAFIDLAEAAGAQLVVPVVANAWPSGPVADLAFEHIASRIVAAIAAGCDAALLDLHGAMVTESHEDGEGELLRRIRRIAPDLPIGVALDMHANVFPDFAASVTSLAGYQTYPHVDMYGTGLRAGRPIIDLLAGRARPVLAWGQRPMLPHVMRQGSDFAPNRELQARCRAIEAEGALAASLWVGFPNADITHAGLSAAVVTDGDPARARALCDALLDEGWQKRADFVFAPQPLADSITRARALAVDAPGSGPIVLLDHCDNCASGGTMDTMDVLDAILDAELPDVAVFAVFDPQAVQRMICAGVGATVTLPLGGNLDMPALALPGRPRFVSGTVRALVDGRYRNRGPMAAGECNDMGPSAVLAVGSVTIAVISNHVEPHDLAAFEALGIDPRAHRFLMLKSRVHWRAGLGPLARAVVECDGSGVCTSDYSRLAFRRLRRPIYPLDPI